MEIDDLALGKWGSPELFANLVAEDYKRERYLSGLSDDELNDRAVDGMVNAYDYTGASTFITNFEDSGHKIGLARFGEVMEELKFRHGTIPDQWYKDIALRWGVKPGSDLTRRVLEWIAAQRPFTGDRVAKFGRSIHLKELLEHGRLRLTPASRYSDPSLNRALHADELHLPHEIDPTRSRFELLNPDRTVNYGPFVPTRATIQRKAGTDAYVFCTSRRVSARLFHDFEADAVLVIRDRPEFMQRLANVTLDLLPGWQMMAFDVSYYDAFEKAAANSQPLFDKPARYVYQHEHRVVWKPPASIERLEPIVAEIGPLTDIAELVDFSE